MKYFLYLTLPLYFLDQLTKGLVVKFIERTDQLPYPPGIYVTSFFNITHIRNKGVAFGMANGSPGANIIFGIVSVTALIVIVVLARKGAFEGLIAKCAAALLCSGILGNLTDRIFRGSVVDFLDFHWGDKHFANFNVADSCICVAAGLIFITAFLPEEKKPDAESEGEAEENTV